MLQDFWRSTTGNMAIITALGATALIGGAGVAVDFVRLNDEYAAYHAAADAATLSAASLIRENPTWTSAKIRTESIKEALRSWKANLSEEQFKLISKPQIKVTEVGDEWTVRVTFKGKLSTSLMGAVGVKDMALEGEAVASAGMQQTHWSFNFAIDTSSSMGIGATQADMDAMQADPTIGCMFACHYSPTGDDTMGRARIGGYKLRLDVVDDAVDNTINIISAKRDLNPKAALFGMTTGITELVAETDNINAVRDHKIQIAQIATSLGNTNFRAGFEELTAAIGKSGDGTSTSKARKMVFIVTDGIHDTTVPEPNVDYFWYADHQLGTVDPAFCQTMKDNGVIVGVLYVKYIVPAGYEGVLSGYDKKILPNMQACASDGFFHDASKTKDLKKAFADLLAKAFASDIRLTQ